MQRHRHDKLRLEKLAVCLISLDDNFFQPQADVRLAFQNEDARFQPSAVSAARPRKSKRCGLAATATRRAHNIASVEPNRHVYVALPFRGRSALEASRASIGEFGDVGIM